MRLISHERGDTIIEVMFAITVFSLVAVGALSLMNQGTAMAQRALEIGLVRQQIDTQADALRYLNSAYIEDFKDKGVATDVWKAVVTDNTETQAQDFGQVSDLNGCHMPGDSFHPFALDVTKLSAALDPATSKDTLLSRILTPTIKDAVTYAKVIIDPQPEAQGIWVEAVQSKPNSGFYDFHITACWSSPGQDIPVKLGTIVRLYEPQS